MSDNKIKSIEAIEILDSRGNPTIQAVVKLDNGLQAKASVPSGASTGKHEALELRDGDKHRYHGLGVLQAVDNINNKISKLLVGQDIDNLSELDALMIKADNSEDKSVLGANAILAVSLAIARVGAMANHLPLYKYLSKTYGFEENNWSLPTPLVNIINGGCHADNGLDWQEFWIIPAGIKDYKAGLQACVEIYHNLAKELKDKGYSTSIGDEGGYAPKLKNTKQAWQFIIKAVARAGYELNKDIYFGADVGASELYNKNKYILKGERKILSSSGMLKMYKKYLDKYPFLALEDPFDQDDWKSWKLMTAIIDTKNKVLIGDDLFVTNKERLQKGIDMKVANAILIKPNQIGSVSETMATIKLAQRNNYKIAISHRSGETTDDFIADLAVAVQADFIKTGAPARGERLAKYNRLLEIYNEIN